MANYGERRVRVRSREFYGTAQDIADIAGLAESTFPELKIYHEVRSEAEYPPRISPDTWLSLDSGNQRSLLLRFHGDDWRPRYEIRNGRRIIVNEVLPMVSLLRGREVSSHVNGIAGEIRHFSESAINMNDAEDDPRSRRITDKLLRLSRKVLSDDVCWFDLKSGQAVKTPSQKHFYGRDMARLCHEEPNLYLQLRLDLRGDKHLGLRPR